MKKFIYSMFLVLATSLVACTEDFSDWKQPQQVDQPVVVTFGDGSVSSVALIDFANIPAGQALVKVCNLTAPSASDEAFSTPLYKLHLDNGASSNLSVNGEVSADFLKSVVEQEYGKAPEARTLMGTVEQWISNGETTVKTATSGEFEILVQLTAPLIEEAYYYVGTSNNWDISDVTYQLSHSGQNVYDDPIFTLTVPAPYKEDGTRDDMWFKFTPKSSFDTGSWDGLLGCEIDGDESLEGQLIVNGQAIKMPAEDGAKFYKITLNMMEYSYKIEVLNFGEFIYEIGNDSGWSISNPLSSPNCDGKYQGYTYLDGEFKFKPNADNWENDLEYVEEGKLTTDGVPNIPGVTGFYQMSVNLCDYTYSLVEVTSITCVGNHNGWNQADAACHMTYNVAEKCWEGTFELVNGFKFAMNDDWSISWGGANDDPTSYDLLTEFYGKDLNTPEGDGTYDIKLYLSCEGKHKVELNKK